MRKAIFQKSVAFAAVAAGLFAAERDASACLLSLQCPSATPICSAGTCVADPTVDAGGGVVGGATGGDSGLGGIVGAIGGDLGGVVDLDGGVSISLPGVDAGPIIGISQDAGIVITLPVGDAGSIVIPPITVPTCTQDSDCGGSLSGVICGVDAVCVPGCDATNACALGLACTAVAGGICLVPTGDTPPVIITDPTDPGDPSSGTDAGLPTNPAGCASDSACGSLLSGLVCDLVTGSCLAGCHADVSTGNGCPAGLVCDSAFDLFGRCVTPSTTSSSSSTSSSGGSTSSTSSSSGGSSSSTSSSSGGSSSSTSSSGGSSSSSSSSGGSSSSSTSSGGATTDPTTRTPIGGSSGSSAAAADAGAATDDASSASGGCNVSGTDTSSSRLTFVGLVLGVGLLLRGRRRSST